VPARHRRQRKRCQEGCPPCCLSAGRSGSPGPLSIPRNQGCSAPPLSDSPAPKSTPRVRAPAETAYSPSLDPDDAGAPRSDHQYTIAGGSPQPCRNIDCAPAELSTRRAIDGKQGLVVGIGVGHRFSAKKRFPASTSDGRNSGRRAQCTAGPLPLRRISVHTCPMIRRAHLFLMSTLLRKGGGRGCAPQGGRGGGGGEGGVLDPSTTFACPTGGRGLDCPSRGGVRVHGGAASPGSGGGGGGGWGWGGGGGRGGGGGGGGSSGARNVASPQRKNRAAPPSRRGPLSLKSCGNAARSRCRGERDLRPVLRPALKKSACCRERGEAQTSLAIAPRTGERLWPLCRRSSARFVLRSSLARLQPRP